MPCCASRVRVPGRQETSALFKARLVEAKEIVRPGFIRVSFPYFFSDATVDYITQAVRPLFQPIILIKTASLHRQYVKLTGIFHIDVTVIEVSA